MDELVHRERLSCEHVFQTPRDKPANALGFAAIVAKGVFVEVGLQMLVCDGTVMGAEQPAFETGRRPVAELDMIIALLFGRALHFGVMWT